MPLVQILEPNQRGVAVYQDSQLLGYEDVVTLAPEQIAVETETEALTRVGELIDRIDSLAKAKEFLRRLCARLIRKGLLP